MRRCVSRCVLALLCLGLLLPQALAEEAKTPQVQLYDIDFLTRAMPENRTESSSLEGLK